jgi:hypothetical protein
VKDIPRTTKIRLNHAAEAYRKILALCVSQLENPSKHKLEEIGSYFGSMASILRSALNYGMWDFVQANSLGLLSDKELKDLKWQHDFPITTSKNEFDSRPIVKHIDQYFSDAYEFLEGVQPYHTEYQWLLYLRRITNEASHTLSRGWLTNGVVMCFHHRFRHTFSIVVADRGFM